MMKKQRAQHNESNGADVKRRYTWRGVVISLSTYIFISFIWHVSSDSSPIFPLQVCGEGLVYKIFWCVLHLFSAVECQTKLLLFSPPLKSLCWNWKKEEGGRRKQEEWVIDATMERGYENGVVMTRDPRPRLRWTPDLHDRFVDAVTKLGGPHSNSFFYALVSKLNSFIFQEFLLIYIYILVIWLK